MTIMHYIPWDDPLYPPSSSPVKTAPGETQELIPHLFGQHFSLPEHWLSVVQKGVHFVTEFFNGQLPALAANIKLNYCDNIRSCNFIFLNNIMIKIHSQVNWATVIIKIAVMSKNPILAETHNIT